PHPSPTRRSSDLARGSKHAMYLGHRRYESLPLLGRYGAEQAGGQPIGPVVQLADLAPAARRRPGRPQALIAGAGRDADQPFLRESLRQTTDVARVEPEPLAQLAQIRAPLADLVQEA